MSNSDEFVVVTGKTSASWFPNKEGKTKETMAIIAASEKTKILGYYAGMEEKEINGKPSTIITLKFVEAGNPNSVLGVDGEAVKLHDDITFFGNKMVNEALAEIPIGTLVQIKWCGKVQPKKAGGNPYNMWEVAKSRIAEPFDFNKGLTESIKATQPAPTDNSALMADDDDDDSPF